MIDRLAAALMYVAWVAICVAMALAVIVDHHASTAGGIAVVGFALLLAAAPLGL